VDLGFPQADLKPKLFCGVASEERAFGPSSAQALEQLALDQLRRMQFTPQYLSNDCFQN
jgi:hypothetical protein